MIFADKGAAALILALALAGCGGGSDEAADTAAPADTAVADPAAVDTAAATPTPVATDSATPAPTASPSATATPSATPTPTASATPKPTASATPSPKPSTVAVARPVEYAQCSACHSVEAGKNGLGPSLAGVFGDKAASVPGFAFSDAMKNSGLTWNAASLDRFLTDPRGTVPGTKMAYAGLKDAAKRQAIINYLKSI